MKVIYLNIIAIFLLGVNIASAENNNSPSEGQDEGENANKEQLVGLFVGVGGNFGATLLSNSFISDKEGWTALNGMALSSGINAFYLFSPSFGVGAGINYGVYNSGLSIKENSIQLSSEFIDQDNDVYFPVYEDVDIEEHTTLSSIDIPLYFKYNYKIGRFFCYLDLGVNLSLFNSMSYMLAGELTRKGYYPDYNAVLYNIPEYNYDDYNYSSSDTFTLEAPSFGVSGILAIGVKTMVYQDLYVKLGVNLNYGFTDRAPEIGSSFSKFYSTTYSDNIKHSTVGIELGVYYNIFK